MKEILKIHKLVYLLILVLFVQQSFSWHNFGHFTIAQIAKLHLLERKHGNEVIAWTESIIEPYSQFCGENLYPFTEAASWSDKIISQGWMANYPWHYSYNPIIAPKSKLPDQPKQSSGQDIVWALNSVKSVLLANEDDNAALGSTSRLFGVSVAMRQLINLVGEVHSPLHCSTYYSNDFQTGDDAGHLFKVQYKNQNSNLHFLWDDLFGLNEHAEVNSPLNKDEYGYISEIAEEWMKLTNDPEAQKQLKTNTTPKSWAQESYDIAVESAYQGVTPNTKPNETYMENGKSIVKQRIAFAGERLADELESIYKQVKLKWKLPKDF